jgi:hypothetical protein
LKAVARALRDPGRTDGRCVLDGTGIDRARIERDVHRSVRGVAARRRVRDGREPGIGELARVAHRDRARIVGDDLEVARDAEAARGAETRRESGENRRGPDDPGRAVAEQTAEGTTPLHQNRPVRPALDGLA